ncbi:hypothetical protein [Aeromicrobium sp. UC242_57]|uniref:hypothetical protein n=1 Tax=Aeromicrobium sp. UC242_57 TaxID=3374624 RepID=UPI00378BDE85
MGDPSTLAAACSASMPVSVSDSSDSSVSIVVILTSWGVPSVLVTRAATPSAVPTHSGSVPGAPSAASLSTSRSVHDDQVSLVRVRTSTFMPDAALSSDQVTPIMRNGVVSVWSSSATTRCGPVSGSVGVSGSGSTDGTAVVLTSTGGATAATAPGAPPDTTVPSACAGTGRAGQGSLRLQQWSPTCVEPFARKAWGSPFL